MFYDQAQFKAETAEIKVELAQTTAEATEVINQAKVKAEADVAKNKV